jgi:hypothetical protein
LQLSASAPLDAAATHRSLLAILPPDVLSKRVIIVHFFANWQATTMMMKLWIFDHPDPAAMGDLNASDVAVVLVDTSSVPDDSRSLQSLGFRTVPFTMYLDGETLVPLKGINGPFADSEASKLIWRMAKIGCRHKSFQVRAKEMNSLWDEQEGHASLPLPGQTR